MEIVALEFEFHWSLFLLVQLTMRHHWFRWWPVCLLYGASDTLPIHHTNQWKQSQSTVLNSHSQHNSCPKSQTSSWMEIVALEFEFHWSLFLLVQLTMRHHWFRWWPVCLLYGASDTLPIHHTNQWKQSQSTVLSSHSQHNSCPKSPTKLSRKHSPGPVHCTEQAIRAVPVGWGAVPVHCINQATLHSTEQEAPFHVHVHCIVQAKQFMSTVLNRRHNVCSLYCAGQKVLVNSTEQATQFLPILLNRRQFLSNLLSRPHTSCPLCWIDETVRARCTEQATQLLLYWIGDTGLVYCTA